MRWGRALLVLIAPALASLAGCELIAGIHDVSESDGGGDGSGEGPAPVLDSGDAMAAMDASDARDATPPDATGGRDAFSESGSDVTGVDGGADAAPEADAQMEAGTQDAPADAPSADAAPSPYVLIDDMEANTGEISAPNGGYGFWFTYGDGTTGATETPAAGATFRDSMISPPRTVSEPFASLSGATSKYAAQVSGSGFSSYAGMGFNFVNPVPTPTSYDASGYAGFVFWGRIGSATTDGVVRFEVTDANTASQGGVCTKCADYLGTMLTFTTSWQEFTVYYTGLSQMGFGLPRETALDAAKLYGVQFQVSTMAPPGEAFDIWVDDIYFIKAVDGGA
jgi:hypothetical protein